MYAVPFPSIAKAVEVAKPGDTIVLRDGLYTNPTYGVRDIWKQDVTMRINQLVGTAAKTITITAETTGAVTLKGDGLTIFQLRQCSYVKVSGLVIEGEVERITVADAKAHQDGSGTIKYRVDPSMTDEQIGQQVLRAPITATRPSLFSTGGLLVQDSAHIEIVGCTVGYAPGTGLRCQGRDYLTVRNCTVHNSSRRSSSGTHGLVLHTLTSAADGFTGVRVVLDSNTIRDNYNEVYSWSELKTFITPEIDEGKGLTIQKSYLNNGWTIGRVVISNNGATATALAADRVDILSNNVYENDRTGRGVNVGISSSESNSVTIGNNIVSAVTNWGGFALSRNVRSNVTFLNNILVGTIDDEVAASDDVSPTRFVDPMLMDAAGRDFRLQAGSPAVGATVAFANSPTTDFISAARPSTGADIGAFESP